MMRLKNKDIGPPDGFRFTVPETRYKITATNWYNWIDKIKLHYKSNGIELPSDIIERASDQLCRQLGPEQCERSEKDANFVSTRMSLADLWNGVKAYAKLVIHGFVSQEEADRRAFICGGCFLQANPEGCGACSQLGEMITGDVANRKTKYDSELKACSVCKCPNKSIVHFPMNILEEADTPEHQALYPEFCWRQKESPNYLAA